jgi:hypothetical protein
MSTNRHAQHYSPEALVRVLDLVLLGRDRVAVERLAKIACDAAEGYLRYLVHSRQYSLDAHPGNEQEIAADLIAEAFSAGTINSTLASLAPLIADPAAAAAQFNLLICAIVRQELPRIFAEIDPEGAKILRNLRLAANTPLAAVDVIERFHARYYAPRGVQEYSTNRPLMPAAYLADIVLASARGVPDAPEFLRLVAECLRSTDEYASIISESDCRHALKLVAAFRFGNSQAGQENAIPDAMIVPVVASMSAPTKARVEVLLRKHAPEHVDALVAAVQECVDNLTARAGGEETQFEVVQRHIPGLSYTEFRTTVRNSFSYAVDIAMDEVRRSFGGKNERE